MFLCSFRSRLENEPLCKIISSGEIQDLEFDVDHVLVNTTYIATFMPMSTKVRLNVKFIPILCYITCKCLHMKLNRKM